MSSINAFIGLGTGSYALSKIALERCGDILRVELKKFGVKVSLIEPGNYSPATNILKVQSVEKYWNTFDEETKASYSKEYLQLFFNRLNETLKNGKHDSKEVIDAIIDALMTQQPKSRYLVATLRKNVVLCFLLFTSISNGFISFLQIIL